MSRPRRTAAAVALAAALCAAAAYGQPATNPIVADPVSPWVGTTLRADSFSTRSNPATLVFLDGWHTAVANVAGAGTSGARSWSLAAGTGHLVGAGVGVDNADGVSALTTGFGLGSDKLAMGFSTSRWFADRRDPLHGRATSRIAVAARASEHFGLSLVMHDLFWPRRAGEVAQRRFVPGLAVRTTGGSFELDLRGDITAGTTDQSRLGATALVRPVPGLRLFAAADIRARDASDAPAVTFGLEVAGGAASASAGVRAVGDDFGFVAAFEASGPPPVGITRRHRHVRFDLAGDFQETPEYRVFRDAPSTFTDLLAELDAITRDPTVDGVFLNMGGLTASAGQLFELRQALDAIQRSGRRVIAYFEQATVRDIYVAGAADIRIGAPTLSVLTTGLGITRTYFGDMLDHLGVRADFVRIGDFKSAPERFTRSGPSPASTQQVDTYLDDVWDTLLTAIARDQSMDAGEAERWLADAPLTAVDLVESGFLQSLAYRDELSERIDALAGADVDVVAGRHPERRGEHWVDPNVIAVLHIQGSMVLGDSGVGLFGVRTGATTIVRACSEIANDPSVRAVIVRIDSGGGSALAADRMQRALGRLRESVPVTVSMGGVAASGGMYAAAFGSKIHATPTTLTGSIGIYAGTIGIEGLLDRIGVHRERDERGGPSDLFDGRGWDEATREAVYEHIEYAYSLFLERVAEARGMSVDDVDAIGQGRIWSGRRAVDNGLVDDVGGFVAALNDARAAAGIRDRAPVTLRHYPEPEPSLAGLLPSMPRFAATDDIGWGEVIERLGLGPVLGLLGGITSEPDGASMAQLEWVFEQQ